MDSCSFGEFIERFFVNNKIELEKKYPGLALSRLKQELEDYCLQYQLNIDDLLDSRYLPTLNSPLHKFFNSLEEGIPLEYIRGKSYFYKSEFSVSKDVLIPRSETEILVEMAVKETLDLSKDFSEKLKIIDIGTGSGAIILSLLQELDLPIDATATDISSDALTIAKRNYFNLRFKIPPQSSLNFALTDRLDGVEGRFHLIVSNPPYIMEDTDLQNVHEQVHSYEPHLALYLKDSLYFSWFEKLFTQVKESLVEKGVFILEGHEDHLAGLAELARDIGFSNVEVINDYTNRHRFLLMRK